MLCYLLLEFEACYCWIALFTYLCYLVGCLCLCYFCWLVWLIATDAWFGLPDLICLGLLFDLRWLGFIDCVYGFLFNCFIAVDLGCRFRCGYFAFDLGLYW